MRKQHSTTAYLDDAYQEYSAAPEEIREKIVTVWVRGWFSYLRGLPDDFADVKPDLMPDVRSRSHFELASLRSELEDQNPALWPYQVLGEHFGVGLVYDIPEGMRSLSQQELDSWGVTFDEALSIAKDNLLALTLKFHVATSREGMFLLATGDRYVASRVLLAEPMRRLPLKGHAVAMIPNRWTVVVAGSDDPEGLINMVKLATEAVDETHPISGIALSAGRRRMDRLAAAPVDFFLQGFPGSSASVPRDRLFRAKGTA